VKYLELCLDIIDCDVIQNQKIESFEMNYLKELSLHDEVKMSQKKKENFVTFSIQKDEKANFALQIILKK
jgi:acyl-ACP thioesterase